MKLLLTPRAERDLDNIQSYYEDGHGSSVWIVEQMDAAFRHLRRWPRSGRHRLELLGPDYWFWIAASYVIVYSILDDKLIVITLLHGSRNLTSALRDLS